MKIKYKYLIITSDNIIYFMKVRYFKNKYLLSYACCFPVASDYNRDGHHIFNHGESYCHPDQTEKVSKSYTCNK